VFDETNKFKVGDLVIDRNNTKYGLGILVKTDLGPDQDVVIVVFPDGSVCHEFKVYLKVVSRA